MRYPLCDRTVTVYRLEDGNVLRFVLENCFFRCQGELEESAEGLRHKHTCLLVIPGEKFLPRAGDRVYDGIGPETVEWERFLPVFEPGLGQLQYVAPQYWQGKICHIEAGRK